MKFVSAPRKAASSPLLALLLGSTCCLAAQPARSSSALSAQPAPSDAQLQADLACERDAPAIAAYTQLRRRAPHLFASVGSWQRGEIAVLHEPREMCAVQEEMRQKYAKRMNAEQAMAASRAGVVLQDPYIIVVREAVRFPNNKVGLYNRRISQSTLDGGVAGAYCLPLLPDGRVVLVREYRHQERRWRLSLPGGFREAGETAEEAGRREAGEETGYTLGALTRLGELDAEGESVPLFIAPVSGDAEARTPDEGEALGHLVPLHLDELKRAVQASGYHDADGTWLALYANLGTAALLVEAHHARPAQ